ncbi:MAG: MFS transporter [Actinomycetota bacterium]
MADTGYVYPSVRSAPERVAAPAEHVPKRVLSQNLLALGFTSFFTDISSEMVLAVVPLFLTASLGFSIVGFGLFEAAYQGTNAVFRIWGGAIADHRQNHKRTAATGYAISTATRVGLVISTFVAAIPAVPFLLADRIGKGMRTAPRDALISLSTHPARLGTAFGIHRSLDTAGAVLGPLLAFVILDQAPGQFDAVFVMSAIAGVIGVAIIVTFAQEKPQTVPKPTNRPAILAQWREVLSVPGMKGLALGAAALSAFTVSDAFVYLIIQRTTDMSARYFPLLFVGTALVYLTTAVPVGRLADRVGARPVFLAGHICLVVLYLLLGFGELGLVVSLLALGLLGGYYAATDGVVAALASRLVHAPVRATGIALITVVIALARMVSAGMFGLLWQTQGRAEALTVYVIAMVAAIAVGYRCIPSDLSARAET